MPVLDDLECWLHVTYHRVMYLAVAQKARSVAHRAAASSWSICYNFTVAPEILGQQLGSAGCTRKSSPSEVT